MILCCVVLSCSVMSDTLWPHDCSPPGSSVHGNSPGKNPGVGCHALFQGIFPTQVLCIAGGFFTIWDTRGSPKVLLCNTNCKLIISEVGLSWNLEKKKGYVCISFEELASVLVEAGKSKICRGVQQAGDRWKSCGFESKNGLMVEFIFPLERSVFIFLRLSTDWTRPTPIMERNLLWLQVGWFKW